MGETPVHLRVGQAVRILGARAYLDVVAAVADCTVDDIAGATPELLDLGISFAGPLLSLNATPSTAEAPWPWVAPALASIMHARAADELARRGAPDREVAAHLTASPGAGDDERVRLLRRAGRASLRDGRPDETVQILERALREPPRPQMLSRVLADLASALLAVGRVGEAQETARLAMRRAQDPDAHVDAAAALYRVFVHLGEIDQAIAVIGAEVERVEAEHPITALRLETELLRGGYQDVRLATAGIERFEARRAAGGAPLAAEYVLFAAQAQAIVGAVSAEEAASLVLSTDVLQRPRPGFEALIGGAYVLMCAERYDDATALIRTSMAHESAPPARAIAAMLDGVVALRRGHIHDAQRTLADAHRTATAVGSVAVQSLTSAVHAETLLESGAIAEARRVVRRAGPLITHGLPWGIPLRIVRGRVYVEAGRPRDAVRDLWAIERQRVIIGNVSPTQFHYTVPLVRALLDIGRHDDASEVARVHVDFATRWGTPLAIATARSALADCLPPGKALAQLEDARALIAHDGASLRLAEIDLATGAAQLSLNRRRLAETSFEMAADAAAQVGAGRIVKKAQEQLRALGRRPRRPHLTGLKSLTPTELRVAQLAAEGLPNKEIASTMHVSVRTVENHLRRVYQKLATNRRDLRDALRH